MSKTALVALHIFSMLFGLYGMVILPRMPDFMNSLPPVGQQIYDFGMSRGGAAYIIFGALALVIHGVQIIGLRKTMLFFIPACLISLASELLGTSTGFPFGAYTYTEGLGFKIAGLVPFTIPLSWFYIGFSTYLLSRAAFQEVRGIWGVVAPLLLGAWLLTAWDLVLDPAMSIASSFWVWLESGPFFGMPIQNFAGWFGTGLVFMAVARWLWKTDVTLNRDQLALPLVVYTANILFAVALSLGALDIDLRIPVAMGLLLGQVPACVCWWLAGNKAPVLDPAAE
ncbi:carotenoid biosynthesis protein [Candidatus Cyanaurora vandensis]|uniref:carotenoid biosynthesis protein n=1 Tax=Candidatus Cyanaurora vandensis TaxID=2714958 RepID=UPI00257BA361|nr:carotenoid biosynthesis protein [Candidatus Cyanaurora vandensis]